VRWKVVSPGQVQVQDLERNVMLDLALVLMVVGLFDLDCYCFCCGMPLGHEAVLVQIVQKLQDEVLGQKDPDFCKVNWQ
jgi:hypothetical protein